MSEARTLLMETADRLFADLAAARGREATAVWSEIEAAGLPLLLVAEADGGFGGDWADAIAVFRLVGAHALEAPLLEAVLAGWAQARSGLAPVEGASTIAARIEGSVANGRFTGRASGVALPPQMGQVAVTVMGELDGRLVRLSTQAASIRSAANLAGEPRAALAFDGAEIEQGADGVSLFLGGALARAAQIAGALDRALALSIEHGNSRSQFGRPIGKFQAVQQNLAMFAEEAAAVNCAVEAAALATDRGEGDFETGAAKLRANEAAALGVTVAHQVHGAIGFTKEHDLHRFTLRLNAWRTEYGNDRLWSDRLGRQVAAVGADGFWPELTRRSDPR